MLNRLKGKDKHAKRRVGLFLLMLCASLWAFGQQQMARGTVLDSTNEPAIGATIRVKGGTEGTITDVDGHFSIRVNNVQDAVLIVSYIGYETQEVTLKGKTEVKVTLRESYTELQEVQVVAYGTQKKETLTGAISSVKTEALLRSPNASVANSLAGQITGLSSNVTSGQPGAEDPTIFVRGVGSLTENASSPLILVDGVERSFFQMDPNEIESITVLKDASATAVFGVRGANGVVMVTTKRGQKGKAQVNITSSVGISQPTRMLEYVDSYTYATLYNEMNRNDGVELTFDDYELERFRLGDEPILYPNVNMREYLMKKASVQTQHNVNISGGTDNVRYFVSAGFLWQDGLIKQFDELDYNNNYTYTRYNYRANLDMNLSKSTVLKVGLGGIVGLRHQPLDPGGETGLFVQINNAVPMHTPGVINGKVIRHEQYKYGNLNMGGSNALSAVYGTGYHDINQNTMNMDLTLTQQLDFITKGLSVEIKGAYNSNYSYTKKRKRSSGEIYVPYYQSFLEGVHTEVDHPLEGETDYNKTIAYKIQGTNGALGFEEETGRGRDWYLEASIRYNRKFGNHNVGALLLYNQSKEYYPKQYTDVPSAYVGLVGRLTYDYKSRYLAEFNFGYNGSENFAPDQRFGSFPAGSIGYILSEESFMKEQNFITFLKLRASVGLVGNDNIGNNRFLYLPNAYLVDQGGTSKDWNAPLHGTNFGSDGRVIWNGAFENRIGNPNVTWETALKQNYGIDINFLQNRLRISADIFFEDRRDILINRSTIPSIISLPDKLLPVVNLGQVKNHGYEIEVKWNDQISQFHYWLNANMSYSMNKIIYQDEVEPNEPYLWKTGKPVGTIFGYVDEGFYSAADFVDVEKGILKEGLPDPQVAVYPGDVKYKDLNGDDVIDVDDQCAIGDPVRPAYTFGLNYGAEYKGWFFSMNWTGAAKRSLLLSNQYRSPFNKNLMKFQADNRWTEERADVATLPRLSQNTGGHNQKQSTMWLRNGNYLKLKTLTFGYNFVNSPMLRKIGISKLGIQFSGYNLLCFDHFDIMDPESNPNINDTYPVTKTYNLGVNITF